jgi:hypothetical protein
MGACPPHQMGKPLLLAFTCYRRTVVCVNHVTIIYQAKKKSRNHVVSPTKKIEDKQRERAWPQHNTETIDVTGDGR